MYSWNFPHSVKSCSYHVITWHFFPPSDQQFDCLLSRRATTEGESLCGKPTSVDGLQPTANQERLRPLWSAHWSHSYPLQWCSPPTRAEKDSGCDAWIKHVKQVSADIGGSVLFKVLVSSQDIKKHGTVRCSLMITDRIHFTPHVVADWCLLKAHCDGWLDKVQYSLNSNYFSLRQRVWKQNKNKPFDTKQIPADKQVIDENPGWFLLYSLLVLEGIFTNKCCLLCSPANFICQVGVWESCGNREVLFSLRLDRLMRPSPGSLLTTLIWVD